MRSSDHTYRNPYLAWWHDRRFRIGKWGLVVLVVIAVFADFIATDVPLYIRVQGNRDFPAFRHVFANAGLANWTLTDESTDWKSLQAESSVFAPVPYSATGTDLRNANFRGPFDSQQVKSRRFRHFLGTDHLGRDVLAGLIHGTRVALLVGLGAMFLAALIGIPLGATAGFLGDDRYSVHIASLIIMILSGMLCVYFIALATGSGENRRNAILLAVLSLVTGYTLSVVVKRFVKGKRVAFPVDSVVLRSLEILRSIPAFFLLFAVLGMIRTPRLGYVVILIAILACPSIIRFVRAEALKLRDQTYIQSATVLGLSRFRIIMRHVIPNAAGPAFITIAFGMGSAVLIESALSFLGIGVAPEAITWGKMLNLARSNFSAWWMAILPGLAIFFTIALFNRLGDVVEGQVSGRGE